MTKPTYQLSIGWRAMRTRLWERIQTTSFRLEKSFQKTNKTFGNKPFSECYSQTLCVRRPNNKRPRAIATPQIHVLKASISSFSLSSLPQMRLSNERECVGRNALTKMTSQQSQTERETEKYFLNWAQMRMILVRVEKVEQIFKKNMNGKTVKEEGRDISLCSFSIN